MLRPVLTIFFQFDPLNPSIGGIQTCIRYIIKFAPPEFQLRLVGIARDSTISTGEWHTVELFGREFLFMPLFHLKNDNVRRLIPTTVRYTLALLKHKIDSDFLQFHRIEPTLVTSQWQGRKILYIHNDIYQEVKGEKRQGGILWRRFPWAYFAIERFLVPQFYQIFSCNSDSAQLYRQRYPEIADRVAYLSNTVDGDLFYALSPQEREAGRKRLAQKLNLPEATRFILFAGRLHPQKDPLLLLQSFAAVQEPNVHLLMVGEGELENDIRSEIDRLNLTNQVTLLGPLKQAELADLYRICSIFVLTSVYEGLARGSIEALACGTPVVTTRAGETPKFLSDTQGGIVCNERTSTVIASALKEVLVHPENYPSEACVHIAQPFDAQSVVSGIYSELLERWKHETHETLKIEVSA